MPMLVTVKLFASFRTDRFAMESHYYPVATTIKDVLLGLGLPELEVGTALVNGRRAELHLRLNCGDTLALFPLLSGG
jgi:sulfur-carrier protein